MRCGWAQEHAAAEKAAAEKTAAQAAQAAAAEAAAAAAAEESSEGEDWDAVDVNQLELPEQKAARLEVQRPLIKDETISEQNLQLDCDHVHSKWRFLRRIDCRRSPLSGCSHVIMVSASLVCNRAPWTQEEAKAAAMAEAEAAAEAEAERRDMEQAAAAEAATAAAAAKAAAADDAASDDEAEQEKESGSDEESGSEEVESSDESDRQAQNPAAEGQSIQRSGESKHCTCKPKKTSFHYAYSEIDQALSLRLRCERCSYAK